MKIFSVSILVGGMLAANTPLCSQTVMHSTASESGGSISAQESSSSAARTSAPVSVVVVPNESVIQKLSDAKSKELAKGLGSDLYSLGSLGKLPTLDNKLLVELTSLIGKLDISIIEQRLTSQNISKVNTAGWHRETTQRLMQLAASLKASGRNDSIAVLVTQSLKHLDDAATIAKKAGDTKGQVMAKASAGFLHERYKGDGTSAIAAYKEALLLEPDNKANKEALVRLEQSEAILQERVKANKRKK